MMKILLILFCLKLFLVNQSLSLQVIKNNILGEEIKEYVKKIKDNPDFETIDFDTFARVFAILLEDSNALKNISN